MAGERTFPGLGLQGGFTPGTDGWGDTIDENFRKLAATSAIGHVASRTTEPPLSGTPAPGDEGLVYILPSGSGGTDGNIAFYDETHGAGTGAWISYPPQSGMIAWVDDDAEYVSYVAGTGWQPLATVLGAIAGGTGVSVNAEVGPNYTALQLDFDLSNLIYMDNVNANDVTIPAGITGTNPIHICQGGAGATSVIAGAGVTINAADGALQLRAQFSVATLMPLASDLYLLVGDLVDPAA